MILESGQKLRLQLEWKMFCLLVWGSYQPRFTSHERIRSTKVDPEILVKKTQTHQKQCFHVGWYAWD